MSLTAQQLLPGNLLLWIERLLQARVSAQLKVECGGSATANAWFISRSYVRNLFSASLSHQAGKIFLARDKEGRVHAGNLIAWNKHCAYYLMEGGDPELRNSGATSLAM